MLVSFLHSKSILIFINIESLNNWQYVLALLQQVGRGSWRHWNELIKPAAVEGKKFQDILIPTMDTVRYSYLMDFFIKHERYAAVKCVSSVIV